MTIRFAFAAMTALLLTACATTPPKLLTAPPGTANGYTLARTDTLDKTDHMTRHLNKDKNIVYTQMAGGGGAGLGLLLGPLGVLANVKLIESKTTAEVALLNDKIAVAPRTLFADAVRKNGMALDATPQAYRATPYLYITKREDKLHVLSAMIVESGGAEKWSATYQYQLPRSYSVEELANLDAAATRSLQEQAAAGFDKLVQRVAAEKQERIDQEPSILFRSRLLAPILDVELIGSLAGEEDDVVWVRNPGNVVGLRKANITYKLNK